MGKYHLVSQLKLETTESKKITAPHYRYQLSVETSHSNLNDTVTQDKRQYQPRHQPESNCLIPQDTEHRRNGIHQHHAPARISAKPAQCTCHKQISYQESIKYHHRIPTQYTPTEFVVLNITVSNLFPLITSFNLQ